MQRETQPLLETAGRMVHHIGWTGPKINPAAGRNSWALGPSLVRIGYAQLPIEAVGSCCLQASSRRNHELPETSISCLLNGFVEEAHDTSSKRKQHLVAHTTYPALGCGEQCVCQNLEKNKSCNWGSIGKKRRHSKQLRCRTLVPFHVV